jgi:DNA polymerase III alpha subunit
MSDKDDRTMLMTQWDKHEIEDVGLYKIDFLGLKTLTKLRR